MPLFATRVGLILAFVVIAGITVATIVPEQAGLVAAMLTIEGGTLAAWLLAAYGLGATLLRAGPSPVRIRGEDAPALKLVTRVALGLGAMSLLTLALGVAGLLDQPIAVGIVLLGDALAVARIYTHRNTATRWLTGTPGAAWLLLIVAPVIGVMAVAACVLPGVLWGLDDPSGYDVVAYHLQLPREWHDAGRVSTFAHNVFSFFPLNVEMHYLLAMHLRGGPWAGMYLAQLMHGAFVTLTIAAVYGFARERGRLAASVAAIVCAAVPWTAMLGGVAFNEGGLMLYATLAAGWALRGRWVLAGACAGLAAGCKLTGVTSAVLLVPIVVLLASVLQHAGGRVRSTDDGVASLEDPRAEARSPNGVASLLKNGLVFAMVACAVVSPWLLRTAISSGGNPVFPVAAGVLGAGHFDAGQVERFAIAHAPRADQQSLRGRLDALWLQVGGDYHYGAIQVAGRSVPLWLMLIVPALWLARRDREAWVWLGLIVGNALVWLAATHLQGRFLVQVIPCVALLVACAVGRRTASGRVFAGVAVTICLVTFAVGMRRPLATLLAVPDAAFGPDAPAQLRGLISDEAVASVVYDTDRPIALLGDAKAFWYAIPSSRLRYRSVFDVPTTKGFRDAWLGDDVPADAAVIVDPGELARFGRTYRRLPDVPAGWPDRPVVRVNDVPE